eukprot:16437953-Heterocapsa_arctica.AAC.1
MARSITVPHDGPGAARLRVPCEWANSPQPGRGRRGEHHRRHCSSLGFNPFSSFNDPIMDILTFDF